MSNVRLFRIRRADGSIESLTFQECLALAPSGLTDSAVWYRLIRSDRDGVVDIARLTESTTKSRKRSPWHSKRTIAGQ